MKLFACLVCLLLGTLLLEPVNAASFEVQSLDDPENRVTNIPPWVAEVEAAFNAADARNSDPNLESQNSDRQIEVLIRYRSSKGRGLNRERAQSGQTAQESSMAVIEQRLEQDGIEIVRTIPTSSAVRAKITRSDIEKLASDPAIKSVHTERFLKPLEGSRLIERRNLYFSVDDIHADEVWEQGYTGAGQTIVILDTGIFPTHEVFANGKIIQQACFSSPDSDAGHETLCSNGLASQIGGNAASNCSAHADACYHGTHVASIAAGNDPDTFITYDGVAFDAKIIAVQVFQIQTNESACPDGPCLRASSFDLFEAMSWVQSIAANYNIAAVNMSLGGGEYNAYCPQTLLDDAVNDLRDVGILTTIASGNEGFVGSVAYPGCVEAAITTSASSIILPSSWANHAPMVDVLAPGNSIQAAYWPPNQYEDLDGTSMAAPHVAGAVALIKSVDPTATPDLIEYALKASGDKQDRFSWTWETPFINVAAALTRLDEDAPPSGTRILSVVSSGSPTGTKSYLRFFNSEFFTDSVRVTFLDNATGSIVGEYIVDVPGDGSIQKEMIEMEIAAGINTVGKSSYTAVVNSDFDGYVQHVIYNPIGAALTNVTSCIGGVATDAATVINIHTSRIPSGYPSFIFIHNDGDEDNEAEFRIYEAGTGRYLGSATTGSIPRNTTISYLAQDFYDAIGFSPAVGENHTNFELQEGFDGSVLHLVNNENAGVITNMTDKCIIN